MLYTTVLRPLFFFLCMGDEVMVKHRWEINNNLKASGSHTFSIQRPHFCEVIANSAQSSGIRSSRYGFHGSFVEIRPYESDWYRWWVIRISNRFLNDSWISKDSQIFKDSQKINKSSKIQTSSVLIIKHNTDSISIGHLQALILMFKHIVGFWKFFEVLIQQNWIELEG